MELKGKCFEIGAIQQVSDSLQKRELIIEYAESPQYKEYLKFEMINDKCSLVDSLKVGDDVDVFFNLRGRPWTDKTGKKSYFNSLQLWRVNVLSGAAEYTVPASVTPADDDDLPF